MLFPEKCFNFGEKYQISGKFLGVSGKFFSYLGKIGVCPEKFFDSQNGTLTENFLVTGGEVAEKIFKCLRAWPPQLFEASYALGHNLNNVMDWSPFCNQILCK